MINNSQNEMVKLITEIVVKEASALGIEIKKDKSLVPVSISARHLHLKKEHLETLFGSGHELIKVKDISQPGQYAAEEKVTLQGPRGKIDNVRVLGPIRKETQIEISATDSRVLGVKPVVRDSGNIDNTPGIVLIGPKGSLAIDKGCIVAERHIHMTPADAAEYNVSDGEVVSVKVHTPRGGVFDKVLIRVREDYALDMHIDVDEANAFLISNGDLVEIVKNK
ncbi:phosphate propanoyltransferase [Clostridium swellfunianum]|uniref:phosphate propanoyltransferase n=1 Tax=Clostridium swellfunianum TaxID=1367462 RepID=UPI00202EE836|nr:phosphate propanoyltransferase [Clostridium swellfunianum]MCM0649229.1 phosphate propanoyltransferase [Clostridium swellfunianum]